MFEKLLVLLLLCKQYLLVYPRSATTDSTVLVTGETGTGKELIAHAIPQTVPALLSSIRNVNCAAIPPSLIASELFGHERVPSQAQPKDVWVASSWRTAATIFLDEVGELPPETQVALLRVLQEHKFERVGAVQIFNRRTGDCRQQS